MSMLSKKFKVVLISTYELGRQPFGLASPAAWLRREGFQVVLADVSIQDFPAEAIHTADLVAFYVPMHTATRLAVPLAKRTKELNPTAHLCFYGLYAPVNAPYLNDLGAHSILGGEFEDGLLRLCNRLRSASTTYGKQAEPLISLNRQQFLTPDRSNLPDLSEYARLQTGRDRLKTVGYTETSRGCKHLCRHCPVVPVYTGKFRIVQPEIVLNDIRNQVATGAQHITFGDPDFFNGIGHAIPLAQALHAEFPDLTYDITVKIEHLLKHRQHLPTLHDTGCAIVTTAVESLDNQVLRLLDKGHTCEDFVEVVDLFHKHKLVLNPTFIPFTPWTTLEAYADFLDTLARLNLADHISPVQLSIRLLIPEGSRLLGLPDIQNLIDPFEPEALSYPWAHPDPQVDQLHRDLTELVTQLQNQDASRRQIFHKVLCHTCTLLNRPTPNFNPDIAAPATIPFLTEPWYC